MRRIARCSAVALPLLLSPAMAGTFTSTTPVHVAPIHIAPVHVAPVHVGPVVHVNPPLHPTAIHATPATRVPVTKPATAMKPAHVHHHPVQTIVPVSVTSVAPTKRCAQAKAGDKGCAKK
jgi:hypothetical protein